MEKRTANIQDVAALAGVSISTVSRVLNEPGYPMRPETKQRVLKAIETLGYRPNCLARGLLGKPTQTIGLIIPDISNPYYPALSRGVEDVANKYGYAVVFCNTDRNADKLRRYLEVLGEKQVDGIIFAGGGHEEESGVLPLEGMGCKVVLVGRHRMPFPSVQVDNVRAAFEATSHLTELGHRRVAFISGPPKLTSVHDRLKGYTDAMAVSGATPEEMIIGEGDFHFESGYQIASKMLKEAEVRPTAIFAANDRMALGAMAAAYDAGVDVPRELSIVGFDDTPTARYVRPALTTVSLPSYEIGALATELLLKSLAGESVSETTWLTTSLIVRQSTAKPPHC